MVEVSGIWLAQKRIKVEEKEKGIKLAPMRSNIIEVNGLEVSTKEDQDCTV